MRTPLAALAHEAWVVDDPSAHPVELGTLFRPAVAVAVLVAALVALAWRAVERSGSVRSSLSSASSRAGPGPAGLGRAIAPHLRGLRPGAYLPGPGRASLLWAALPGRGPGALRRWRPTDHLRARQDRPVAPVIPIARPGVLAGRGSGGLSERWGVLAGWSAALSERWGALAGRLAPMAPRIVGAAVGASLLGVSATGHLLSASREAPGGWQGAALIGAQAALGLVLGLSARPRAAGIALALTPGLVLLADGPLAGLEQAHLAGIGLYLAAADAGWPGARRALRWGLGVSLVTLAVTEKLANAGMARAVLDDRPRLDVTGLLGWDHGPELFIVALATIELALGLVALLTRVGPTAAVVVGAPFVLTVPIFGMVEVVGHLPLYGVIVALAVTAPALAVTEATGDAGAVTAPATGAGDAATDVPTPEPVPARAPVPAPVVARAGR